MNKEYYIKLQAKIDEGQKTVTQLNSQITSLQGKIKQLEIKVKAPTTASKGFGDLSTQLNKLKVNMSEFQNNILSTNSAFDTTTTRYTNNAGKMLTVTEKLIAGEKRYKVTLKEVDSAVEANAKQADKWKYSWTKAFQSFTTYMSVTTVFYQTINTIKDMINEVVELDSALTELRKVTDLEGGALDNFVTKAYNASEAVAKTGTEMVQAATEFAKAGYDESQILQLGQLALMYTNIADEQVSAAEASEFMIAQMKAFNIETEDAIHIIDAVNEVANRFAVSSADIANNLGKSSAVMANAGNSYEEMIGLLTAGTEITRNASKVANGLKTITLRLQGMNDEGEKDLDLMASMEKMFNKLNLSVYKTDGSLKNTYEILQDLAPVYQEATAAEKAYITETIAGKYQAQNAAAILNNFETALAATETALNSEGSAMEENAKVMDSIKGKINQFKSAFEELSNSFISSGLVKGVVDFGTALLKIANSDFVKFIASATLAFATIKGGLAVLGKMVSTFTKLALSSNKLTLSNNKLYLSLIYLRKGEQGLGKYLYENVQGYKNMTAAQKRSTMADYAKVASQTAVNLAVGAAALLLTAGITIYQKYQQAQEKMRQSAIETAEELDAWNEELDNDIKTVEEYKKILDSSASSEAEVKTAKENLITIQDKLIERYGEEARSIDFVNGKLDEEIEKVKKLQQEEAQLWINKNQKAIYEAKTAVNDEVDLGAMYYSGELYTNVGKGSWKKGDYAAKWGQNRGYDVYNEQGLGAGTLYSNMNAEDTLKFLNEYSEYLQKNKKEVLEAGFSEKQYQDMLNDTSGVIQKITDRYADHNAILSEYKENALLAADGFDAFNEEAQKLGSEGNLGSDALNELLQKYPAVKKAMEDAGITIDETTSKYNNITKAVENFIDAYKDNESIMGYIDAKSSGQNIMTTKEQIEEVDEALAKYGITVDDVIDYQKSLASSTEDVNSSTTNFIDALSTNIDTLQGKYDTLTGAVEEFNSQGYISASTFKSLIDNDLIQYLTWTKDGLIANTNELFNQADAYKILAIKKLQVAYASDVLALSEGRLEDMSDGARVAISKEKTELDGLGILAQAQARGLFDLATAAAALGVATGDLDAESYKADLESLNSYYNQLAATMGSLDIGGGSSQKKTTTKNTKEWWEEEFDKLKDQFKYNEITIEQYISSLDNLLGRVNKGTEAWRKINEELQKQRLTKVEDDYKRGSISLDEYIKRLKELIKAYKQGTDAWNELADKIKKGLQDKADKQKDDYDTAEEAAVGIIEDEIEKLQQLKDEQEEYYDQLIADKEKANEETERELELARLQEALANAQKEKTKRVWRGGIGWVWAADQEAVREAQEALDEFNNEEEIRAIEEQKEQAISAIEEQIDAWEKYKESWEGVADDYETQQARITLANQLGADAEAQILQQRLDVLEKYKQGYLATMKEIADLENTPADKLSGYNTPGSSVGGGSGASATPLNQGSYVSVKPGTKWYANSYGGGNSGTARAGTIKYINNNGSHPYNIDGLGWVKKSDIVGYANGGMVDYTGLAMLHGSKSKPEFVLNNDQMRNMLSSLTRPQTTSSLPTGGGAVTNYNFGNIELPNVTNARQFVTELKSLVNITKHQ